jgi:hypothetical protein
MESGQPFLLFFTYENRCWLFVIPAQAGVQNPSSDPELSGFRPAPE